MVMQKDESNPGSGGESTPRQSATPNSSGIPGDGSHELRYCECATCTSAREYREGATPERPREQWGVKSDPLNAGVVKAPPCPCAACQGALPEASVSVNSPHDKTFGPKGRLDLFVNDERRSFKLVTAKDDGEVISESFFGIDAALAISRSLQGTLAGWADPSELDAELLRAALERLKGAAIAHASSLRLMKDRLDIPESLESTAHELAVAVVAYAKAAARCP